jgi:hypothetical protein
VGSFFGDKCHTAAHQKPCAIALLDPDVHLGLMHIGAICNMGATTATELSSQRTAHNYLLWTNQLIVESFMATSR